MELPWFDLHWQKQFSEQMIAKYSKLGKEVGLCDLLFRNIYFVTS